MKQFFKMFFASMLAMIVSGVIIVAISIGLIVGTVSKATAPSTETTTIKEKSVLVLNLSENFHEQGESNSFAIFSSGSSYSAGLYDALHAIEYAKKDDNIKGILIKLAPTPNGWATTQQLREAIRSFRLANKFVYAYGEDITQGAYFVGSAADSVYLNPVGDFELKGLASTMPYFKGALEKLEIQPEIFYAGKFKSATEPFRADKMSDANREQVTEFLSDFWNEYLNAAADHAHTDTNMIHQLAATGAIQFPNDALQNKLVDGLLYWDEVEKRMRAKTGTKEKDEINYVELDEYADNVRKKNKTDETKVAVLFAEGDIVGGDNDDNGQRIASEAMTKQIRKLAENDKIKAVVLRVNSPGGSALASEVILRELELLHKKKPVVVSMGDVAASGGYYISCQADSIFAMPNTITGSIGVFGMMFNTSNLMKNKLGVTFDGVKNTPYADFPTGVRPMTADEMQRMQHSVDNIYEIFKSRVAKGRKLSMENVDSIAQGRVWTGTDAKRLGLVDGMGDLDRAIESAAALAKVKTYQTVTYPSPSDKFEKMVQRMKGFSSSTMLQAALKQELAPEFEYYQQVKDLYNMNGKTMMA
ncbi:MAG: signal peptide peptidase SppA, partial [Sphingobacteriales bacterium]